MTKCLRVKKTMIDISKDKMVARPAYERVIRYQKGPYIFWQREVLLNRSNLQKKIINIVNIFLILSTLLKM